MTNAVEYNLKGFNLTIYERAYLVEVRSIVQELTFTDSPTRLPEWVFQSRHTIWLSEHGSTLLERAEQGEAIKRQLLRSA